MQYLMQSQKWQNDLCLFPRQTIQYHSNPSLCPNHWCWKAEVQWFYEDLQDLLELIPKKDVLFIIEDWNAKVESQEIPVVTGKFGLGVQNEAGQRLIEFCQENALVIANHFFQEHKRRPYTWTSPEIRLIMFFAAEDAEALSSQLKQDQELTMAQIMSALLKIHT